MRLFLLLCCLAQISYARPVVKKTAPPSWINKIDFREDNVLEGNGGYQYLLLDLQDNLPQQTIYRHYAIKIMNAEGIQSMSDISVSYDPTYQKLSFHEINLIRDGQTIHKLPEAQIQTFQRETNMERSLYDGSLSAVINLSDVREGDIIEYAYSVVGFNPINQGHYANTFYHQAAVPINRVYNRLLASSQRDIQYKLFRDATKPTVQKSGGQTEYVWDVSALDYELYDNNVPIWYDPYKRVAVSTFDAWKEVVDWALPLYNYPKRAWPEVKQSLRNDYSEEGKIVSMIRLVQDEVRYLGLESGIGAYKPHDPQKVYRQKYGDCKDKSLLLVSLLRSEGLEAYPLLVNSQLQDEVSHLLPSHGAFDHCVVNFRHEGKDYFIDPTISNQGGDLEHLYFPNYRWGLLIKPGTTQLLSLPTAQKSVTRIKEIITVDSIGGSADFVVRSEYEGNRADYIRSYFSTNAQQSIKKEYLNYYSNLYPSITSTGEVKLLDYERHATNKVVVEESYHVKNFWQDADDESYIYCETYPLVLESQTSYTKTANRNMPYYMGEPFSFFQTTQVVLPEAWSGQDAEVNIAGEGFAYHNATKVYGNTVLVSHRYTLEQPYIGSDAVEEMLEKHEQIRDEFAYYLTYNASLAGFSLSWISIALVIIAIGLGIFFAIKVYREYDPPAWQYAEDKPIGSWLILPAIGLTLSPLLLGFQIFTEEHFNQNTWAAIFSPTSEQPPTLALLIGGEIVYNFLLFVFTILVLVVFYQRRTSTPVLVSVYYVVSFLGPLVDTALTESFYPEVSDGETYRDLFRSFIAAAIWVPYFNISERAKSTFCRRLRSQQATTGGTVDTASY